MGKALAIRCGSPLANARHEMVAQALASGAKNKMRAYAYAYRQDLRTELELSAWDRSLATNKRASYGQICNRPDIKARTKAIMQEAHDRRMDTRMDEIPVTKATIMGGWYENYLRSSAQIPVLDGKGNHIGLWKADYKAANQALELMGNELGMGIKQHKHLHENADPLEGNRNEVLGSIRGIIEQLSDADLRELGVQRLDVVETSSRRVNGAGDKQEQAVSPLS